MSRAMSTPEAFDVLLECSPERVTNLNFLLVREVFMLISLECPALDSDIKKYIDGLIAKIVIVIIMVLCDLNCIALVTTTY